MAARIGVSFRECAQAIVKFRANAPQLFGIVRQLLSARSEPVLKILNILPIRSALLKPESLLEFMLPSAVARDFDVFGARVRVPGWYKLWLALRALPVRWDLLPG